ncbi:hypothetical protein CFC21_010103 [Triticum aestivum]|uniref:KIB1-4 beta-propeller domain-containing protein n=3 Tax=Triticinae TaxID=1648030 RepID=A0A3B5ZNA5_WHEAT|nr:uncharacterized protein LOC109741523 [Aegilops tauschii subsp. strangulata]KAF6993177.1 hypothetical protein CFC21_010103 [Triticum aestivum]
MGRSKGAAARRRKAAVAREAIAGPRLCPSLPPELLANIHDRLGFLDRIAFAAVFASSSDVFSPSAPWLLLPGKNDENAKTARLLSVADRRAATVHAPYPALRDHLVIGSSRGWLATADGRGQIYLVNPASGEQHALPHVTTMRVFLRTPCQWFTVCLKRFMTVRFGGGPPFKHNLWGAEGHGARTVTADHMGIWFYRKVVLSVSPSRHGSYGTAMLILHRDFGAPAFATAEDAAWKLAPSRDGVEDAIYHDGQFYSVSYTGVVEAWQRDTESGTFTSTAVTPKLIVKQGGWPCHRKYLAAGPGGRLMVVLKYAQVTKDLHSRDGWTCTFKVHVLGDDGQWKETMDIGDVALFVGVNTSLCVPTMGCPGIMAGCIYFTNDELGVAKLRRTKDLSSRSYKSCDDEPVNSDIRALGVYSLKDGMVKKMEALQQQYRIFSAPPVWITPSVP